MKKLMIIALAGIALAGCKKYVHLSLPYFNTPDFTPVWVDKTDPAYRRLHTIPPFAFTDQNGQLITQNSTRGKIYVANFFFTRCGNICPKMMDNMKKVSAAFAGNPNVIIISHSVAPWYDDVSVLKKYAAEKDINNPNWHLVTGSKEQIYSIARQGYFADAATKSAITTRFLHTENFILVDRQGHIRGVYNGTIDFEVDNLMRHIKVLEKED
jgi:protein SCO1/2